MHAFLINHTYLIVILLATIIERVSHDEVAAFMNERLLRNESIFLVKHSGKFQILTEGVSTVECDDVGANGTICRASAKRVHFIHTKWVRLS